MILTLKHCGILRCVLLTSVLLALCSGTASQVSAQVTAEKIFPNSTKGFLVIRNLDELGREWQKTQIGTLMNDPIMEAFKKDSRTKLDSRMEERFGFTLDEISKLPSGEVAAGMVAIPDTVPGYVFTMDVKDRRKEVDDYLDRLTKKLLGSGTKRSIETYKDTEIIVFTFPNRSTESRSAPAAKTPSPAPSRSAPKKPAESEKEATEVPARQAFYLIKDDHLVVADRLHLVRLFIDRMEGELKNSLAEVEDFKIVMERCMKDVDGRSNPLIRWYIEPLDYGESVRILLRGPIVDKRRSKPSIFTILKEQGFDAVRGVGGVVSVKAENMETIYRIFALTKKPYRLAMKMLTFPDNTTFEQPTWTPADVARCTMVNVDPTAIFDNMGSLFDALVMQGETGIWDDIVKGLKEDENGPQIDLREEIIVHLGQRVFSMSKYLEPITTNSECIVVAVELKDGKEKNMVEAMKKLFENDPEMEGTKYGDYILWHREQVEEIIKPFGGPTGAPDLVGPTPAAKPAQSDADQADPVFPSGAVTVAKGYLFFSTKREYLKTVLDRLNAKPASSVNDEAEYKTVLKAFDEMGMREKPRFLQFFGKTAETIRPTYEMIRQGTMPQSQSVLSKMVNAMIVPEDKENRTSREQVIDGKNLPEFDKVKKYFGPAGITGTSEENGLFFKGFLLEKQGEAKVKEEPKKEELKLEVKAEPKKEEPKTDEKK